MIVPVTIPRSGILLAVVLVALSMGVQGASAANSITSPDTIGDVGSNTSSVLDAAGHPVVSYFDLDNWDLKVIHCNDPNCAGGDESITSPDTVGQVGLRTSLALDSNGNPVVSYLDWTNWDLKVLHCNDPNCAGGDESITSPDTVGNVGVYTSLALDGNGNPVVSYFDWTNDDLKVLHCNDPNCAGGDESVTSPDSVGRVGLFPSLTLDGSGNPVVSYWDQSNKDLKVLHCNDPNCAGGGESITSPDTAGNVGFVPSLTLDGSGNPVVSYYDYSNGDLKVLHCNDPNCAGGGESITSTDTAGDVGNSSSLELDSSGNPVVSYYDATNGDLKVLHCFDPDCTSEVPTDLGDEDGVPDTSDLCPGTIAGPVDANGCSDAQVDLDGDNVCDPGAPSGGPSACTGSDNCPSTANPGQENQDGDQWGDACENCPTVATLWVVPVGDDDCDSFSDAIESFVGTDSADSCANTAASNDEVDDRWPADTNDDQIINVFDVVPYIATLSSRAPGPPYTARLDLNASGKINTFDVVPFIQLLNKACLP